MQYFITNFQGISIPSILFINGSTQNGTVREVATLAVIKNRLYLCSAFGKQVRELEY